MSAASTGSAATKTGTDTGGAAAELDRIRALATVPSERVSTLWDALEPARAMRYVIYFNQNFITIDTLRAIGAGLKAEGLGWHLEQVGAVSGSPAYGKNPKRPPSMYRNKEDMRPGNMRLLLTIKPLF